MKTTDGMPMEAALKKSDLKSLVKVFQKRKKKKERKNKEREREWEDKVRNNKGRRNKAKG